MSLDPIALEVLWSRLLSVTNEQQAALIADRCAELGLLSTGSSDFHGPDHQRFSSFRAFRTYGREPVLGPIAG